MAWICCKSPSKSNGCNIVSAIWSHFLFLFKGVSSKVQTFWKTDSCPDFLFLEISFRVSTYFKNLKGGPLCNDWYQCCPILLKLCTVKWNQTINKQPKCEVSNSKNKKTVFQKVWKIFLLDNYHAAQSFKQPLKPIQPLGTLYSCHRIAMLSHSCHHIASIA